MSKSKPRQLIPNRQSSPAPKARSPGSISVQLGFDPKGPAEPVDIVSSKEGWSEYTLVDGAVIRSKGVILDVKKMIGQYDADGDPIYILQLTIVNKVRVPGKLKKNG
jgi:hypothetical protein